MTKKESEESILKDDVNKGWLWFEQEILYARNYNLLPSLSAILPSSSPKNSILEQLLPGLLYIKAISLLDEGLTVKIDDVQSAFNDNLNKEDLYHRIQYLTSHNFISSPSELHELRQRRRILAHASDWQLSWKELLESVATIRECLQGLGIVGPVPNYTIKGERSQLRESEDPNAHWERTIRLYILDGAKMISEISSVQKTMRDNT